MKKADLGHPLKDYNPKSLSNTKIRTTMQASVSSSVSFFLNGNEIISDLCWWCLEQVGAHLLTWFTRGAFFLWAKCCTPCKTKVMALTQVILEARFHPQLLECKSLALHTGNWNLDLPLSAQFSQNYFAASLLMAKKSSNASSIQNFIQNSLHKYSMRVAYKYTCFCWKLLLKFTALHTPGTVKEISESS